MNRAFFTLAAILMSVVLWSDTLLSTDDTTFIVTKADAELTQIYDVHTGDLVQQTGSNPGEFAPHFELMDMSKQSLSLNQLQGQTVLLNIWASYCPACVHEMPMLDEIAQTYHGLKVIGINAGEHPNTVRQFLDQTHISYPVAIDTTGEVTLSYQAVRLPATWLINHQGQVIWKKFGGVSRSGIEFQLREIANISEAMEKSQGF